MESPSKVNPELTDAQVKHNTTRGIALLDECLEAAAFRDLKAMQMIFMDEEDFLDFSVRGHHYMESFSGAKSTIELDEHDMKGKITRMLPKLHLRGVEIVLGMNATYVWPLSLCAHSTYVQNKHSVSSFLRWAFLG